MLLMGLDAADTPLRPCGKVPDRLRVGTLATFDDDDDDDDDEEEEEEEEDATNDGPYDKPLVWLLMEMDDRFVGLIGPPLYMPPSPPVLLRLWTNPALPLEDDDDDEEEEVVEGESR